MKSLTLRGQTGNIAFVFLPDSTSTVGAGKTGLTNASAALNISVRRELSATVTAYTGANIGAISTLGTWADPGAGKCNFKEVDSTNLPGVYELHFVDLIFGAGDTSRRLICMITATGVVPTPFEVILAAVNVQSANAFITGVNSLAPPANWNTDVVQTGDAYARLGAPAGASIAADLAEIEGETDTLLTGVAAVPTAAQVATAVWTDLLVSTDFGNIPSIGNMLITAIPNAAFNSNGGLPTLNNGQVLQSGDLTAVWNVPLPGAFGAGTAGRLMGAAGAFAVAPPSGWLAADTTSLNAITANVFNHPVESGVTFQQMSEMIGAYLAGNANFNTGYYFAIGNGSTARMHFTLVNGVRTVTITP